MAPRLFLVGDATVPPVEDTHLREVDLRQLSEKAQLSVELVTMCLESASDLQAVTSAHTRPAPTGARLEKNHSTVPSTVIKKKVHSNYI